MSTVCSRFSDASQARRMFSADGNVSFGQSPMLPYNFVAITVF